MNHHNLINTCVFEQFQVLLFSDLSGPLTPITLYPNIPWICVIKVLSGGATCIIGKTIASLNVENLM